MQQSRCIWTLDLPMGRPLNEARATDALSQGIQELLWLTAQGDSGLRGCGVHIATQRCKKLCCSTLRIF